MTYPSVAASAEVAVYASWAEILMRMTYCSVGIDPWTVVQNKIHPAVAAVSCSNSKDEACVTKVAEKNVLQSMQQIRERSPYLAKYFEEGKVRLIGAMYDVATGKVTFLDNGAAASIEVK